MSEFAVSQSSSFAPPVKPEALIGAASPLWAYYLAAAAGGMAFWWATRWMLRENLEAAFDAAEGAHAKAFAETPPLSRSFAPAVFVPAQETPEPTAPAETQNEPAEITETVAAAGPELAAPRTNGSDVVEALAAPEMPSTPIGGEAGPISPVLDAVAQPTEPAADERPAEVEPPRPRPRPRPPAADAKPG